MECGLWRKEPDGDDFLIRRFASDEEASLVAEKFWSIPVEKRHREYYVMSDFGYPPITAASIRERPGLFIGDLGEYGMLHLILEVVSNSVDQYLQGFATQVWIRANDHSFEVEDDGAGCHRRKANHVLTHYHYTATADKHAPHIHLSWHGIGICPVNALCSLFVMESSDVKGGWSQQYSEGILEKEDRIKRSRGALVKAEFDKELFKTKLPLSSLRRKCFEAVHLLPGLKISLNEETFYASAGLLALAEFDAGGYLDLPVRSQENKKFGFNYDGDEIAFSVACIGTTETDTKLLSWVNGGRTEEHGTHVEGALDALNEVGWTPAYLNLSIVMKEPQYAGPTKHELGTKKVRKLVKEAMIPELVAKMVPNGSPVRGDQ